MYNIATRMPPVANILAYLTFYSSIILSFYGRPVASLSKPIDIAQFPSEPVSYNNTIIEFACGSEQNIEFDKWLTVHYALKQLIDTVSYFGRTWHASYPPPYHLLATTFTYAEGSCAEALSFESCRACLFSVIYGLDEKLHSIFTMCNNARAAWLEVQDCSIQYEPNKFY